MIQRAVTLSGYFENVYLLYRRLEPGSAANVRRDIGQFTAFTGFDPPLDELDGPLVSRFVEWLEQKYQPKTVANKRASLLAIWNDAYQQDETGRIKRPTRVRAVRVPDPDPDALDPMQVAALVEAARRARGVFAFPDGEVRRCDYLEALIRAAWDSGLRKGNLLALRLEKIGRDGQGQVIQLKTRKVHVFRLRLETVEKLRALKRNPPLAWTLDRSSLAYWISKLKRQAGIDLPKQLQLLRSSGATDVARQFPGRETGYLGHTSPRADARYVDRKRAAASAFAPSELPLPRLGPI